MSQSTTKKVIRAVYGPEPMREGETPDAHVVGFAGVTRIEEFHDNLGHYGIVWFLVFKGNVEFVRMNALHTASVQYMQVPD